MRRLLVLVLTLLLLLVSLPAALVSAEGGKPIPDAVAEMIERASVDGPLPVIVTLPSIDAQRGVIASQTGWTPSSASASNCSRCWRLPPDPTR